MRKRRNTNDFRAYSANRECTKKYANVNISGTRRGTRNGYPTNDTGTMRAEKKKHLGQSPTGPTGIPTGPNTPTWLNYSSEGTELTAGSKRKHREYLAHLSHAFFWKYPLTKITTEDINRWLANLDNFGGATPRKKTFHLLKAVYAKAVAEGAVDKSLVTMKAPAIPKSRQAQIPPATAEELQTIYAAMPNTTRISVWLGAILDLRIGEVVSLHVWLMAVIVISLAPAMHSIAADIVVMAIAIWAMTPSRR